MQTAVSSAAVFPWFATQAMVVAETQRNRLARGTLAAWGEALMRYLSCRAERQMVLAEGEP